MSEPGVHLLDATGNHCRYPLWESKITLRVCGEPGYPWCPKHRAIVYQKRAERVESVPEIAESA